MHMTDAEIKKNFKNASNSPKEQVQVLADLNGVPVLEMAKKMKELGLDVDTRWFTSANNAKKTVKKVEKVETPEALTVSPLPFIQEPAPDPVPAPKDDKAIRLNKALFEVIKIMMED